MRYEAGVRPLMVHEVGTIELEGRLPSETARAPDAGQSGLIERFDTFAASNRHHAVAVQAGQTAMTYGDLADRSLALAYSLSGLGVTSGSRVLLCAKRSQDALVAMLAIVRCGATYVPFDPAYPTQQLAFMLEDAEPDLILADADMQDRIADALGQLPSAISAPVWVLGKSCGPQVKDAVATNLKLPMRQAKDPLYVMYTSGSTGRPKGVIVPDGAVIRLVVDPNYCSFRPDEVVLHLAPLAFDASTFEIWGALLNGGCLAIVPEARPPLDDIASAIRDYRVTTAWMTAGLFHLMIDHQLDSLKTVRQLLAGGDVLSPPHVRKLQDAAPDCQIINGYGPTENTTFTCCAQLDRGAWASETAPIGRAIHGTQVHIVDKHLQPVAPGVPGQLVASGQGLAIGYLRRPELTAEKFVDAPAPISARVYLTGDLVCELPNGEYEFLGRIDNQVKIDGKRVEPGEIEAVLRSADGVVDAAVVVERTASGIVRLAAFVAAGACSATDFAEVAKLANARARAVLPEYMWPTKVIPLATIPITPNGKRDTAALIALFNTPVSVNRTSWAEVEGQVAAIWRRVLAIDDFGLDDVFFDLGGRSLQLMQVHAALQQSFGVSIRITEMFAHPTIRALANLLSPEKTADRLQENPAHSDVRARAERQRALLANRRTRIAGGGRHG